MAIDMGAKNAVIFNINEIIFDPRTILKCMFGCENFGKNHTCPLQKSPLGVEEYKKILMHYKWGVIINCKDKKSNQHISYEIEREAFLDGYHFAFSLSDCGLCKECTRIHNKDCNFPKKARPTFHSVGIDVFKTAKHFNLPLKVAKTYEDEINWYSAVFIE